MVHSDEVDNYISQDEGPLRHALWMREYVSLKPIPRYQLRLFPGDAPISTAWAMDQQPVYFLLHDEFSRLCKQLDLPRHNAVAFWHSLLDSRNNTSGTDPLSIYKLTLGGVCNYGDFFSYAFTKSVPADFVWPEDLASLHLSPVDQKEDLQQIEEQLSLQNQLVPERDNSLENFEDFRIKWNQHLVAAKRYKEWKRTYSEIGSISPDDIAHDVEDATIYGLACIFREYVELLNSYKNSEHADFEQAWMKFSNPATRKDSSLFYSFQRISHFLKTIPAIAQIAPVYVLSLFRCKASKLYKGPNNTFSYIDNLSATDILSARSSKGRFYKKAQTNTRGPNDAQLVTYQILCQYFQENGNCLCEKHDLELCNYMVQSALPLVDQCEFKVAAKQVGDIISGKAIYPLNIFLPSETWVHPLLERISHRLKKALSLSPDKVPHISSASYMGSNAEEWIKIASGLVDDAFISRYLECLVLADGGLGNPRLSAEVMKSFADLVDEALVNSQKTFIQTAMDDMQPEDLYALETGVHMACSRKIFEHWYESVLLYLYKYLQSEDFCCGMPICSAQEFRHKLKNSGAQDRDLLYNEDHT